MTDVLRIKRRLTGAAGAPSALANAELAYNELDDTLYYGKGGSAAAAASILAIAGPGKFATLLSPGFGGVPTAPTAAPGTNTTQLATTAFVIANASAGANFGAPPPIGNVTPNTGAFTTINASGRVTLAIATANTNSPSLTFQTAGNGTDANIWDFNIQGLALYGRLINDAYGVATNWLTVTRSGMTVSSISLNGALYVNNATIQQLAATAPLLRHNVSNGAADAKIFDVVTQTGSTILRFVNDTGAQAYNWLVAYRSGYTCTSLVLTASAITLSGPTTVAGALASTSTIGVSSNGGANGYATLQPGDASHSGYVAFWNTAGTRVGYIGFVVAGGLINFNASEGGTTGVTLTGNLGVSGTATIAGTFTANAGSILQASISHNVAGTVMYSQYVTNGAADAKYAEIYTNSASTTVWRFMNDAYNAGYAWMQVGRAGYQCNSISFTSTGNITLNCPNVMPSTNILVGAAVYFGYATYGASYITNDATYGYFNWMSNYYFRMNRGTGITEWIGAGAVILTLYPAGGLYAAGSQPGSLSNISVFYNGGVANGWSNAVNWAWNSAQGLIGSAFYASSDRRLKSDIRPIEDAIALAWIQQARPVTFVKEGRASSGFIAQEELETVRGASVTFIDSPDPLFAEGDGRVPPGIKLLKNYEDDIAYITRAMQIMMAENAAMAARIATLEARL
jgi:hypothetical protein